MIFDDYIVDMNDKMNRYRNKYKDSKKIFIKYIYYLIKFYFKINLKPRQTNTWYKLDYPFNSKDILTQKQEDGWNKVPINIPSRSHLYMDINKALEINPNLKGIWLVFFMGIGDYFYATRFIEQLKNTYPNLELNAFVSKNFDGNNSPLVADLLKNNPNINKVEMFDGYPAKDNWENYDYSDCYSRINNNYILCPMVYRFAPYINSRYSTLCETFGLNPEKITRPPLIYDYPISNQVQNLFNEIKECYQQTKAKAVVFVQLSSRSSNYLYDHKNELIKKLLENNFIVVSVEKTDIKSPRYFEIDIKIFNICESISLLELLNKNIKTYCLTLVSLFWSVSSALNIPNLGMQHKDDPNMASVYFPNLFVLTHRKYNEIPSSRQFVAQEGDYSFSFDKKLFYDKWVYNYDFVYECFKTMLQIIENGEN